jgi:hypothetical protein
MVGPDAAGVERALLAGQLGCPGCAGVLRPWGWARRRLRDRVVDRPVRLRRSRCAGCRVTHVLLPVVALARRRDLAELIGAALVAGAAGRGHRAIAAELGLPPTTVRGWLRRFERRAGLVRARFTRLAFELDPTSVGIEPRGSPMADALEAIGVAAAAAARRLGPGRVWWFVAGVTGGGLLAAG